MDDNGGHPSSLLSAIGDPPPPDRGRTKTINPMEDVVFEDSSVKVSQVERNDDSGFSGYSDSGNQMQDGERLIGNGSFTEAVHALFPNGIANAKKGTQKAKLITPRLSKSKTTSSRGGRGGGRGGGPSRYLQLKESITHSDLHRSSKKTKLNGSGDTDLDDSKNSDSTEESTMIGWEDEDDVQFKTSSDNESEDDQFDYTDRKNDFMTAGNLLLQRNNNSSSGMVDQSNSELDKNPILETCTTNPDKNQHLTNALPDTRSVRFSEDLSRNTGTHIYEPDTINRNSESSISVSNTPMVPRIIGTTRKPQGDTEGVIPYLKVTPGEVPPAVAPSMKTFTYNVQLTLQRPLSKQGKKDTNYNVPDNFKQVVAQLRKFSPAIVILPYNRNGLSITHEDQLPDESIEAYMTYFHNHRVTPQGHLIGMFCMEAPFAWYEIKNINKPLFKWMRDNAVYMKYVSFKADNVSAAGWLWNAHPDTLRREEATTELKKRLGDNLPKDLNFQLSARPLAVALQPGSKDKFFYRGIAVECDRSRVQELQEAFYKLENPKLAKEKWNITGAVMFIPFLVTKAFPHSKILGMAKAHVLEMGKLEQTFLQNVGDIDQILQWKDGSQGSLRSVLTQAMTEEGHPMIHSVHRTNKSNTILILYYKDFKEEVEILLNDIHELLENQVSPECHGNIFVEGTRIYMSGRQNDISSVGASAYSSYADEILEGMNPQGGDAEEVIILSPPRKRQNQRNTPPRMTYSAVTAVKAVPPKPRQKRKAKQSTTTPRSLEEAETTEESDETSSSQTEETTRNTYESNIQSRLDELQKKFNDTFGEVQGISIEKATELIEESNKRIKKESEEYLDKRLKMMSLEVQAANDMLYNKFVHLFDQQTTIIQNMQGNFEKDIRTIYEIIQRSPSQYESRTVGRLESLAGDGTK